MKVELRGVDTIKPCPGNPRANAGAVDAVAASIREFGWRVPIVVDVKGVILAGHTRLLAARKLGLKEVPVHVARGLSSDKARAYRLADNRTAEIADWDIPKLVDEMKALADAAINMEPYGFEVTDAVVSAAVDAATPEPGQSTTPVERPELQAPFPWFGGKSRAASIVWERLGSVTNYVEPFFGSGAVLLGRPNGPGQYETVNDIDGFVCNAWRAIALSPEETARHAGYPVYESDLTARHAWLTPRRADLTARLEGDPEFHDPKIAGWWIWGMSLWIGGGFCSGNGPWRVVDGELRKSGDGEGVARKIPDLGSSRGVSRRMPCLRSANGVTRKRPELMSRKGLASGTPIVEWFSTLSERLRRVRVCCGDWVRVLGPTPTTNLGLTGVFLDPPYSAEAGRDMGCYAMESGTVAHDVRKWAVDHGDNPKMRIAFCGYEGEHIFPPSWECVAWTARGGYGNQSGKRGRANKGRERIWFSPYCLKAKQCPA